MKIRSQRKIKWRNVLLLLVVALLIAAALFYFLPRHTTNTHTGGMPGGPGRGGPGMGGATPVHGGTAKLADVPVYLTALGTVVANASVTVTSRVDGQLMQVYFAEGQKVAKGQLLAQIDPRSYQATLEQYQGELAQNQALLKSAQLTLARYKTLFAQDSLARQDLETQTATVGQYLGTIKADQAQINAAKLDLDYARITAPVSGRVGLRLVDPGNMVHSSDTTGIVTITQTQPIAITFSLPQAHLPTLLKTLHQGQSLPATAIDQDGVTPLGRGKLNFISNEIDSDTGSIKLKAIFDNNDESLYPNQFVNVRLQTDTLAGATVIPAQALQLSSDGDFVYVIKADNTVERKAVKTGPAYGDNMQAILSGVAPGDRVVTEGIDRLSNGSKVSVVTAATAQSQGVTAQ
ncbi:MdtA/MuxA family multidrug efflux RND transporter periplasmic adaptor subunit [Acerihabitans arboris]|uniref:MdtA/MuxA family multidrug efflux RND transporter periplasmic adaptor subunit n=1 Tax=Acerihabitans arboris TaxID=2691583 RepID=A0A845SFX9_9GAMM|nr:MdtA/MuxA family multidrug efflux RND transporter periplasmic adaptor subunit [Acerihabitans arboris]NDL61531.1 MdtA/MuxA family multidrug efflux RND transporter periplasmic adaptor subunit [Acerihabitans arboris]